VGPRARWRPPLTTACPHAPPPHRAPQALAGTWAADAEEERRASAADEIVARDGSSASAAATAKVTLTLEGKGKAAAGASRPGNTR
jgi:hypothetical protein